VYPRLAVVAPDAAARDAALVALRNLGASPLYPSALNAVPKLTPHLAGEPACPVAQELASRVLTLPTHRDLLGRHAEVLIGALQRAVR
jgi:dTDP-4-amino-4,6-dideoxygalactose transaminase